MADKPKEKPKKPEGPSNISVIITRLKTELRKYILKIKGLIIHAWMNEFEDQYLKTFKIISEHEADAKTVIGAVYKRMEEYNYPKDKCIIIVRYTANNDFAVIASKTNDEKEYIEFQNWKKTYKKEVK